MNNLTRAKTLSVAYEDAKDDVIDFFEPFIDEYALYLSASGDRSIINYDWTFGSYSGAGFVIKGEDDFHNVNSFVIPFKYFEDPTPYQTVIKSYVEQQSALAKANRRNTLEASLSHHKGCIEEIQAELKTL